MAFMVIIGWSSVVVWRQPPSVIILRPLQRGSGAGWSQLLPVSHLRPPGRSYIAPACWQLPVLGLWVLGSVCAVNWGHCHSCHVCGHLTRGIGYAEASCCLFGVCRHLRNFWKVHSMGSGLQVVWISLWKRFCLGGVSENHLGGARAVSVWLMKTETLCPPAPARTVGRRLIKWTMVSAGNLVPERSGPPSLVLKPHISIPPHMSLAISKLLSFLLSLEQVFVSK